MNGGDPSALCTFLVVPGDRPDRIPKALSAGADVVIVDLEDAVAPSSKPQARAAAVDALDRGAPLAVRVNGDGADLVADLEVLERCRAPLAILLPEAEDPAAVARVAALGAPVIALVESAAGLVRAAELTQAPGVVRLAFDALDYALDLDATLDQAHPLTWPWRSGRPRSWPNRAWVWMSR